LPPYLAPKTYRSGSEVKIMRMGRLSPNFFNFWFHVDDVIVRDVIGGNILLAKNGPFSMTS